jgi:hypothetical protein
LAITLELLINLFDGELLVSLYLFKPA